MATVIQLRGDTTANWASANPVLAPNEVGRDTTTGALRFGDGATAYLSLPVYNPGASTPTVVSTSGALSDPGISSVFAFNTAAGNLAMTLFAASGSGSAYTLVNTGANVVTITLSGSDTCNGVSTITLNAYASRTIAAYAAGIWSIIAMFEPGANIGASPEVAFTATGTITKPSQNTVYKVAITANATATLPAATGSDLLYLFDLESLSTFTFAVAFNGSDALESGVTMPPLVQGASIGFRDIAAGVWAVE